MPLSVVDEVCMSPWCQRKIHFMMRNSFHGGVTATSNETQNEAYFYGLFRDVFCKMHCETTSTGKRKLSAAWGHFPDRWLLTSVL